MTDEDPQSAVDALAGQGERLETATADGPMVWHRWGSGPTVVLFHGGWGSWTHWFRVIPQLAKNFTVLAGDTPGFGDSCTPSEPHSGERISGLMTEALIPLIKGAEPIHIIGFSNGGLLGGLVARNLGPRCRTFTAVGSAGFGSLHTPPRGTRLPDPDMSPDQVAAIQRRNLEILMLHDPGMVDALTLHIHTRNLARGRISSRRISLTNALVDALPRIKARISGIWGEFDATASDPDSLSQRRAIFQSVQPDAPFFVIKGAGHWVMHEAPDAFLERLLEILDPQALS